MPEAENDQNRKKLSLCSECHQLECIGCDQNVSPLGRSVTADRYNACLTTKLTDIGECLLFRVAVEKRINRLGVLCCISAWWICCIGVVFCLMMRSDFCNNCYKEKFLIKAHERRRLQLYMDDHSLCEPPRGTPEKIVQRKYIVQPK